MKMRKYSNKNYVKQKIFYLNIEIEIIKFNINYKFNEQL